jgi:plastocyanin
MKWILATASIAVLVAAASAQAGPSSSVTIRHQVRGCHTWSVNGGAYKASQVTAVMRGTAVMFTNNDVMPHTLIKTSGPALKIQHAKMGHMSATAKVVFSHAGVYKLRTRAGEDYPGMDGMKTIGEDNVLRLTVIVH